MVRPTVSPEGWRKISRRRSTTPVSTLVGFRGESQTVTTALDWQVSSGFRASFHGAYTTVHGDYELDMYHWGLDLARMLPRGTPEGLADKVLLAVDHKRPRVVYPAIYGITRWLRPFATWMTEVTAPSPGKAT